MRYAEISRKTAETDIRLSLNLKKGSALVFDCAGEEKEFSVTNILWL